MRILLIEDEKKTAAFLTKGLREAGFAVELARDGEKGVELARASHHDLLIVDVMLPKKDGWAVVSQLRVGGLQTPVLFLTARDSVRDRVKGLELGADDYLVKPYAFSELLARIRSILRRSPSVDELASRSWQTLRDRISGEATDYARVVMDFRFDFRESTRPPHQLAERRAVAG